MLRGHALRAFAVLLAGIVVMPGCVRQPESREAIIYFRDDAAEPHVEQLFRLVDDDPAVEKCEAVMRNSSPAADNPARPGPGPNGDPFYDQWLEVRLGEDTSAADVEQLQQDIESSDLFDQTVRRSEDGEWWHWR